MITPEGGRLIRLAIKREGYAVDPETWQDILNIDPLVKLAKMGSRKRAKTFLLEKMRATKRGAIGLRSSD